MTDQPYQGLATTFDTAAELYEQARPTYPAELFDDLASVSGLQGTAARVLEIGPGTGQATRGLLGNRWRVTGLEPGAQLAAVARRALTGLGEFEAVVTPFEHWNGGEDSIDLVFAATAWHWLDPVAAFAKVAELLRPGGHLAIVSTEHVMPETDGDSFFREVQAAYDAVGMGDGKGGPTTPDAIPATDADAMAASGLFEPAVVRRYVTEHSYDADAYIELLSTYSGHIAASPEQRDTLFADIRDRVSRRPEGLVRKHYLNIMVVGRRSA